MSSDVQDSQTAILSIVLFRLWGFGFGVLGLGLRVATPRLRVSLVFFFFCVCVCVFFLMAALTPRKSMYCKPH